MTTFRIWRPRRSAISRTDCVWRKKISINSESRICVPGCSTIIRRFCVQVYTDQYPRRMDTLRDLVTGVKGPRKKLPREEETDKKKSNIDDDQHVTMREEDSWRGEVECAVRRNMMHVIEGVMTQTTDPKSTSDLLQKNARENTVEVSESNAKDCDELGRPSVARGVGHQPDHDKRMDGERARWEGQDGWICLWPCQRHGAARSNCEEIKCVLGHQRTNGQIPRDNDDEIKLGDERIQVEEWQGSRSSDTQHHDRDEIVL